MEVNHMDVADLFINKMHLCQCYLYELNVCLFVRQIDSQLKSL